MRKLQNEIPLTRKEAEKLLPAGYFEIGTKPGETLQIARVCPSGPAA